ncbi:hypothetical protein MA16_Dca022504 [Dendrobium catenatum]|uniref:Uncharacterized protein n=1 Tax=Dendrobium catenatum TaxID=906689 RepID=A0A2I0VTH0_9ASPA|nr:hypothetical protein MA16_Dca022504 [Dendrobium catenatum]
MEERLSSIDSHFENLEDMMKKMIDMQSKASPAIPRVEPKGKEILEKMMRKLMEMRSKTLQAVPITIQDLTEILLAKSKGKDIRHEKFDEENFFHQEPPFMAPIRRESELLDGGIARKGICGEGYGVANYIGLLGKGSG